MDVINTRSLCSINTLYTSDSAKKSREEAEEGVLPFLLLSTADVV